MKKSKRCFYFLLLMAVVYNGSKIWADNRPVGLLTDLLEYTDRVYLDGYPSTLTLSQMPDAIETMQVAKVASAKPSFSWIVPGKQQGTRQTAYRIILSQSYDEAMNHIGSIWDSGETESAQSTAVRYAGEPLKPGQTYYWRVKTITNTEGESDWSEIKGFCTAAELVGYAQAGYPLTKTAEYPVKVTTPAEQTVLADFGKAAFGQLKVTLSSETGRDSVFIHLGEQLKEGRINRKPGGTVRYHMYPLALMKGTHTYRIKIKKDKRNTGDAAVLMPAYIGEVLPFRYCEIERYAASLPEHAIQRESVYYPFDDNAASFSSSNDVLNQVWELCKYSIKATSFLGTYVDGDRERIPYEADALINQLSHYGVDREYSMARRSHEYLLKHPTWPTEWILQAVLIAWNDYLYTGDDRSLQDSYAILKKRTLLELREQNDLISTTTGLQSPEFLQGIRMKDKIRDIVDWPHTGILGLNKAEGGEADGFIFTDYNAVTNAYHYEALKLMSAIAGVLNLPEDKTFYAGEARTFKERYNKAFLDKRKGYYKDGITTDHASLHANMFALAFGLTPEKNRASVADFIRSRRMACSVYGAQFLMDAVYEAHDADYALSLLTDTTDRSWYNMIRVGSTISLEAWDDKYKPNQDWNHAWGAVPANTIPRKLMGIEPVKPGYELVRIKPQTASLEWAKIEVPTIRGSIGLSIENKLDSDRRYTLRLHLPANMSSEVYLPLPSFADFKVTNNGQEVKAGRVKGEPFLFVGTLMSGNYELEITGR